MEPASIPSLTSIEGREGGIRALSSLTRSTSLPLRIRRGYGPKKKVERYREGVKLLFFQGSLYSNYEFDLAPSEC